MSEKITPIGEIVKNVFRKMEDTKTLTREDVEGCWKEIVGETGATHSRPAVLRKSILTIWVDNSVWLQELTFKKRKSLKALQRVFGKDKISDIQFKIGEF